MFIDTASPLIFGRVAWVWTRGNEEAKVRVPNNMEPFSFGGSLTAAGKRTRADLAERLSAHCLRRLAVPDGWTRFSLRFRLSRVILVRGH